MCPLYCFQSFLVPIVFHARSFPASIPLYVPTALPPTLAIRALGRTSSSLVYISPPTDGVGQTIQMFNLLCAFTSRRESAE